MALSFSDDPLVTVIIPVGPGHVRYIKHALESVLSQTFPRIVAIVVNDSGYPIEPGERFVVIDIGRANGASAARNIGLNAARTPFIVFLDADDFLDERAIEKMLRAWARVGYGIVHTDAYEYKQAGAGDGMVTMIKPLRIFRQMNTPLAMTSITTLIRREDALHVGGFDEGMLDGGEDHDFYCRLRLSGVDNIFLNEPLLYYRSQAGTLRKRMLDNDAKVHSNFEAKYGAYLKGTKPLPECNRTPDHETIRMIEDALQTS